MKVTAFEGIIENGQVRLPADVRLPEKSKVYVPVDADQVEIARVAWRQYGKGRHTAGLNFGDCFSYSLPALFHKGSIVQH